MLPVRGKTLCCHIKATIHESATKRTMTSVARQNIRRLLVVFLLRRRTSSEAVDIFLNFYFHFYLPLRSTVFTSQHWPGTVGSLTSVALFCIGAAATGNKSSQSGNARVESPSIGLDVEKKTGSPGVFNWQGEAASLVSFPPVFVSLLHLRLVLIGSAAALIA